MLQLSPVHLILACAFLSGIAQCAPFCPNDRILGGDIIYWSEKFPFTVSLHTNDSLLCGATIISSDWVLTAAHCVWGSTPEELSVECGSICHTSMERHQALQVITRDDFQFNGSISTMNNDIALIKIDPLTFGPYVQPIQLPNQDEEPEVGTTATILGWGRTEFGPISPYLREVDLEIVDQNNCKTKYEELDPIFPTMICADKPDEVSGVCYGDNGGPVIVDEILHGIVSFGHKMCETKGFPAVATRVAHFRDWINEQTGI